MDLKHTDKIIKKLISTHTTISTMESCTSGLIASMLTDTEGASAIFPGCGSKQCRQRTGTGVFLYSNKWKGAFL